MAWCAELQLYARLQGMGAIQEDEEQVEMDESAQGLRSELVATERHLQLRDYS